MRMTRTVSSLKPSAKCTANANSSAAENYYAHEYPDEELEWSDEFDHNAYHYAAQNFSENEEWDDRDFADEAWDAGDTVKNF